MEVIDLTNESIEYIKTNIKKVNVLIDTSVNFVGGCMFMSWF